MRAWRSAAWQRRHVHHVVLAVPAVLSRWRGGGDLPAAFGPALPAWLAPLSAVGVLALGALAGALLRAVYNAARAPESGRQLGVLADLACFWPREAHPIVPPCYAMKVAPELAARTVDAPAGAGHAGGAGRARATAACWSRSRRPGC